MTVYYNDDGVIRSRYIDNFFVGRSSAAATISILEFIFGETDEFSGYSKVYLSGDTGNGFKGYDLSWFYSTVFEEFSLQIEVIWLCPLHAYNTCDTHGGHLSQKLHEIMLSCEVYSVRDFAETVAADIENATAYYHTANLCKKRQFPKRAMTGIRQQGQMQFRCMGRC